MVTWLLYNSVEILCYDEGHNAHLVISRAEEMASLEEGGRRWCGAGGGGGDKQMLSE